MRRAKSRPHFSADKPISDATQDRLGRAAFAKNLADRIRAWSGDESLVIGLQGEWGCGKSSLKNLIVECLASGRSRKLEIIDFRPWELSQHTSISAAFFREMEASLGRTKPKNLGPLIRKLRTYGSTAGLAGVVAKVVGLAVSATGNPEGTVLAAGGEGLSGASNILTAAASTVSHKGEAKAISLAELKRDLSKEMGSLRRPMLAIVDDIDRLTAPEIRELFQLIKANVDFPNLIFLLLFDRRVVSKALTTSAGVPGDQYLEKIIQVSFNIPDPLPRHVHKVLFAGIDEWLDRPELKANWDQTRWVRLWGDGFGDYFNTLRSVYRFLAGFSFHVSLNRGHSAFELNPLDLLVLETLRLFEPPLFDALPRYRNLLVGNPRRLVFEKREADEARLKEVNELLGLVPEARQSRVRTIIGYLFPRAMGHVSPDSDTLLRTLRAGHEKMFDAYFSLGAHIGELSESEIQDLIQKIEEPEAFVRAVERLNAESKLRFAFERLDSHRSSFQETISSKFVTSLANASDVLPERTRFSVDADPFTVAWRLVYFGLRKIESEEHRFEILKTGLMESSGIRLPTEIAQLEQRHPERNAHEFLVNELHSAELITIALEKIRAAAGGGRLKGSTGFGDILFWWRKWAGDQEVKRWSAAAIMNAADALWLLREILSRQSETSSRTITRYFINLDYLGAIADVGALEALTKGIRIQTLAERDALALKAFRYAQRWRKEGRPAEFTGGKMGTGPLDEVD